MTGYRRTLAAFATIALFLSAGGCGSDGEGNDETSPTTSASATTAPGPPKVQAQVASYDLSAGRPQRVIIGLVADGNRLVSFGSATFSFAFLGTRESQPETAQVASKATATWIPIPGQDLPAGPSQPKLVAASDGAGVYTARDVVFDRPGFWGVKVDLAVGGEPVSAQAQFDVRDRPAVVAPGSPAPRTDNPLVGASGVPPRAIDSRAESDGSVPDPELHAMSVATAIASGRPTMVVISTPVYCVSQFCGPITDLVQRLATEHKDRMNFVHIEVWRDFETKKLNEVAGQWIVPPGSQDAAEPWVFLVGADGQVIERWDNVASEVELVPAVEKLVA